MLNPAEKYEYKIIEEVEKRKVLLGVVACFPVKFRAFFVKKYAKKVTANALAIMIAKFI